MMAMAGFGLLAYVMVGAARERVALERLPARVGEERVETTYWEDVQAYTTNMWIDFYIAVFPGLVPEPIVYERQDKNSLGALQTRTRNLAKGLAEDGSLPVPKF